MRLPLAGLLAWVVQIALLTPGFAEPDDQSKTLAQAPVVVAHPALAEMGIAVTAGAAAGYVPDAECASCHVEKWDSFQQVGMGKSFYAARGAEVIEQFDGDGIARFYHAPSKRFYEMELRGDTYWFRRYQRNVAGDRIHLFERRVDWVMGSGHHSRVYLYRTSSGELRQLPLAWYTLDGGFWEMSPGFEFADHPGVGRQVRRRCMACHNGFPEVAEGSDADGMPEVFPASLPEGIGCQRCHGPGAAHLAEVYGDAPDTERIKASIVNPADLSNTQLYSICYGCHMQPAVAVTPELRPGRGAYSFRPGEELQDFKIFLDITDSNRRQSQRFDINHHPYRLEQSACFLETQESEAPLGCLTCHDPHRKVPAVERADHYRQICLSCHEVDQAGRPQLASGYAHPEVGAQGDCVACHMPTRRTQDVIHTTMTDHKIQRDPGPKQALVMPMQKVPADVTGVHLLYPDQGLSADEALLARAVATLKYSNFRHSDATDLLQQVLGRAEFAGHEPYLALARAGLSAGRYEVAREAAEAGLRRAPDNAMLLQTYGNVLYFSGATQAALTQMRALVALHPDYDNGRYNLATTLNATGAVAEALEVLAPLLTDGAAHWPAWRLRARMAVAAGEDEMAIEAYLEALRVEPSQSQSLQELAPIWQAAGQDPALLQVE